MKINNKILVSLLIVLIAAISLSAVSAAEDVDTNAVSACFTNGVCNGYWKLGKCK